MSNISAAGGFKAPAGITGRNDGGGPGSGNFYGGPGYYDEEQEQEEEQQDKQDEGGNPFKKLTFVSPAINLNPGMMNAVRALAASVHYQKVLQDALQTAAEEEYESEES